jgi:hypothetical protein
MCIKTPILALWIEFVQSVALSCYIELLLWRFFCDSVDIVARVKLYFLVGSVLLVILKCTS